MQKIDCLSIEEITGLVKDLGEQAFRGKQLYNWLYHNLVRSYDEMANIPQSLKEKLKSEYEFTVLEEVKRKTSQDGSIKFLFKLEDGEHIETVLLRDGERFSGCISTQVGCRMGCKFCATFGAVGYKRNLTVGEILNQVAYLRKTIEELFEERLGNLVFMGMGEPLDNLANLKRTLRILLDDEAFGFSHRKITVSTSGLIEKIKDFFTMDTPVNLAVSINASNEMLRREIMPVTNRNHLADLIETLRNIELDKRKKFTLEYVLLGGVNDTLKNAKELVALIKGIKAKVNLIVFNGSPYSEFKTPKESDVLKFQDYLKSHKIDAFIRKRLGQDIDGACGQLAANYKGNK